MKRQRSLLLSTSALTFVTALGALTPQQAVATCLTVSSNATISTTTSCVTWTSSNLSLTNTGTITGATSGIMSASNTIGNLTNSGTISGTHDGFVIGTGGSVGTITTNLNSTIAGGNSAGIYNNGGTIASIANTGTITGSSNGILNTGSIDSISNFGSIAGSTIAGINNTGTITSIVNNVNGSITGSSRGVYNQAGGSIGTFVNYGSITGPGNDAVVNNGTMGTATNYGYLFGQSLGFCNCNGSSLGTLTNNGTIDGARRGLVSVTGANVGTVVNNGTIIGSTGLYNHNANVSTFTNNGAIIGSTSYGLFIDASGGIGTLDNEGTIRAATTGIFNNTFAGGISTIINGAVSNSGLIQGINYGIYDGYGVSTQLINNAAGSTISGGNAGIYNGGGTIGSIINAGTIIGISYGISNGGGTIGGGATAINSTGTIVGGISNAGIIIGNINVNQNLTIYTGTGTLTGGTITTNNHDLTFDTSANQVLNDNINVGASNTVTVAGIIQVNGAPVSITGNYTQNTGGIGIGVTNPSTYGELSISGNATIVGSEVTLTALSGSFTSGEVFTIAQAAGTTDFSGLTAVVGSGLGGIFSTSAGSGVENLIVTLATCGQTVSSNTTFGGSACILTWTGGNLSITSSGHISGSTTAIVNTGNTVGTLTNSGTISGTEVALTNTGTIASIANNATIYGAVYGIVNTNGSIGTITNNGSIGTNTISGDYGIFNQNGTLGAIVNNNGGVIQGGNEAIYNSGTITSINNNGGTISANTGIYNGISIGSLTNSGTIIGNTGSGLYNAGALTSLSNNTGGTIAGFATGVFNGNVLGTINNSGVISGSNYGIYNQGTLGGGATAILSTGTIIGGLSNSGTIIGNINVNQSLTLTGSIGSLTGGTITTNNHDLVFAGGSNQVVGDALNVGASNTVTVGGALQVNTPVSITGNYTQSPSGEFIVGVTNSSNYGQLSISGNATMIGDVVSIVAVSGSLTSGEVFTIAEATSSGSDYTGIVVSATGVLATASSISGSGIESLIISLSACSTQTISSNSTFSSSACGIVWTGGNLSIASSGYVSGSNTAILNSGNSVGTLTNSGTLVGVVLGVSNSGTLTTLTNSANGLISGGEVGIFNSGTIGLLTNDGTIRAEVSAAVVNQPSSTIGSLTNNGLISGPSGISNGGTIGTLTNNGSINAPLYSALYNYGSIGSIINSSIGTITGANTAITNVSIVSSLSNSGLLSAGHYAISNSGTLAALANNAGGTITYSSSFAACTGCAAISSYGTIGTLTNSGLIEGANAIYSGGTILSAISNTGTIAGNINVNQALTLTGGSAGALGSLTGYNSAVGTISTNNNNLTFDSGAYQLMDDDINVGASNTVFNNGLIRVNTTHTVTGNYSQAPSATLVVGVTDSSHYGELVISGTATLTGSSVLITPTSGSLSNGETLTIVQASNSGTSYSGVSATAAGFTATTSTLVSGGYDDLIVALSNGSGGSHTYATLGQNAGGVGGSVGAALDQIAALVAGGNQSSFAPILTALNNIGSQQSPAAEAAAIKQLAPSQLAPQLTATNLMANQTMDVIGQHQTTLLEQHGRGGTGKAAGSEIQAGVLWMQVDGGFASQASSASVAGYHQNFYGMTFGADDHITKKATAGVAVSWVHSASRGSDSLNGDAVAVSTPEVSAYGSYRFGPAFVDGMLGVGYNMYSQSRGIGFLGSTASSSYGGMQYMGNLESGYDFTVTPRTTVTPLVGLQAVRTATDSYSETGAGAADLTVGHQIIDSYASSLGGRVTTVIPTVLGSLTPEVKLAWAHNLNNGAINTSATMAGVGFATSTPRSSPDGAELSLAATLQRTDNLSLRAEYDGDLRDGYQSHTGMLKGEYKF